MLVSVELTGTAWPVLTGGLFHYSSAPHHRRFEMGITNNSGGRWIYVDVDERGFHRWFYNRR